MEKVVVPQFVADWFEQNKKGVTIYGLLHLFSDNYYLFDGFRQWVEDYDLKEEDAQEIIAKMYLFQNYEIKENKCYWRKKKEHFLGFEYISNSYYVNYNVDDNKLSFDDREECYPYITKFTESEIIELVGEEGFKKLERVEFYE